MFLDMSIHHVPGHHQDPFTKLLMLEEKSVGIFTTLSHWTRSSSHMHEVVARAQKVHFLTLRHWGRMNFGFDALVHKIQM